MQINVIGWIILDRHDGFKSSRLQILGESQVTSNLLAITRLQYSGDHAEMRETYILHFYSKFILFYAMGSQREMSDGESKLSVFDERESERRKQDELRDV